MTAASPVAQIAHDSDLLDRLAAQPLTDQGLTECCRLIVRYENHAPTSDLAARAQQQLEAWGLERREAFRRARTLWFNGFRPALDATALVGSGADTTSG
ncbi:MAG: DUF3288 family protein [Cyanobium sp. 49614_E6]|nr:DUF3288 family protein [Cyanobium sp. 49614_E6]